MISKAMLAKCQNELGQAWAFMPDDVKRMIAANCAWVQRFDGALFAPVIIGPLGFHNGYAYRLSPVTPTEPEVDWDEVPVVTECSETTRSRSYLCEHCSLHVVLSRVSFLGIIYEKDGVETLRTSVDASFGTPKRVRLRK